MIVITYFELNPDLDPSEIAKIGETLLKKGLYPVKGAKQLAWYITPDYWGLEVGEVENPEVVFESANMWRIAKPGLFKTLRIGIAMKTESVIPLVAAIGKKIKG